MNGTEPKRMTAVTPAEALPWWVRGLLGCSAAAAAVSVTYWLTPLRPFPLLLAFPAVVLASWFLGMWGGVLCGLTDALLVDRFFTSSQFHFSPGWVREELRLTVFLLVSILLGWTIRRLAQQRALLATQELQQRLVIADANRALAEARAQSSEALRERDDVLQIALRANGMGLWAWDLESGSVQCSDEMYLMYGRKPGTVPPTSEEWTKLIHPDDIPLVQQAVSRTQDAGSEIRIQYRVPWPDESIHWIETSGIYQRDSRGHLSRLVGVSTDITGRKRSEEAMLRAEKLAVAGRLAASVAHEINNPLEAVANLLYLIAHAETMESAHTQAQQALDELMRVSLITQQTLKFHRQPGLPKSTALSEVVHAVLALFRGRLRAAQIEAEVHADRELNISCQPGEVQQIFANLISNAIDAMPGGGRLIIRLRPSCDWRDAKTAGMRITFFDSGAGMDRSTISRIFEPFFTTKAETGTGLGMWVVAQLVERHRGQVRVWSTQRPHASATAITVFLPFTGAPGSIPLGESAMQAPPAELPA
jgi:signal transduction histidine kinase